MNKKVLIAIISVLIIGAFLKIFLFKKEESDRQFPANNKESIESFNKVLEEREKQNNISK